MEANDKLAKLVEDLEREMSCNCGGEAPERSTDHAETCRIHNAAINPNARVWLNIIWRNREPGRMMRHCCACQGAIGTMHPGEVPDKCPLCGGEVWPSWSGNDEAWAEQCAGERARLIEEANPSLIGR